MPMPIAPAAFSLNPFPPSHGTLWFLQVTNNPENDGCINAVLLV